MPHLCPPLHVPITGGDALALFLRKRKPFFYSGAPGLNCIMWGLVSQPGIKLGSLPGAQSLSHWIIRKVPLVLNELSISSEPWHRLFPQPWTPLPTSPFLLPNSYSSSETQMKCSGEAFSNTPPAPRHHPASLSCPHRFSRTTCLPCSRKSPRKAGAGALPDIQEMLKK